MKLNLGIQKEVQDAPKQEASSSGTNNIARAENSVVDSEFINYLFGNASKQVTCNIAVCRKVKINAGELIYLRMSTFGNAENILSTTAENTGRRALKISGA